MTVHVHRLDGCAPAPLAAYLKALAVMRLLGEQRDPAARGFWRDGTFTLITALDRDAVQRFFLHEYRPTPIVAPWNGGSGFYPKDSRDAIEAIAGGDAARFAAYRQTIELGRALVKGRSQAPKDEDKAELLRACRVQASAAAASWLDASLALMPSGRIAYPALLGTGGNDGRLDFTNNQMQRLVELMSPATGEPLPGAEPLLRAALWGEPTSGLRRAAIGQFLPGAAGVNPWDFVLMLEGAVLFQVAISRRLDAAGLPRASAPFAVDPRPGDYASAADENSRGEQWMPLWGAPATLAELRALLAEGRLQMGQRRARSAVDAARAVARLGTARGVPELVRYGYIERNGLATLAVPLGRWPVANRPEVNLLDDIAPWLERLRAASNAPAAPASLGHDVHALERIVLALCREGSRAARWCELLIALGRAEDNLVARGRATAELDLSPIPQLRPEWLEAADDGSAELRLAAALASQTGVLGPIRRHCIPLDPWRPERFACTDDNLARDHGVVWQGTDAIGDLGAVAWRRLLDGRRSGAHGFDLRGRFFAPLADIGDFLAGAVDDTRLAGLARGLMAVRWDDASSVSVRQPHDSERPPWPAHALFRLLYLPAARAAKEPGEEPAIVDPAPLRLLLAGRLADASLQALRRVVATLGRPRVRELAGSAVLARRLAASLCFPVSGRPEDERSDLGRLRRALLKPDNVLDSDSKPPRDLGAAEENP